MFAFILIFKERERKRDWRRDWSCFPPLPNLTIICILLRVSGFDFLAKGLQFVTVHWTGERVQNQHLDIFSADLTFLDWIISRKLWNFERKLPYDTGKPFGPRRLNLFKSAQLQGAWLPAPSPRRRRSLRTPRVLWLGLVQLVMFKALSILSGIWHRHAEFVIWEDNKWLVAWRKAEEKQQLFYRQQGGSYGSPGMLLPTCGNLLIPSDSICCFVCKCQRHICCNLGCPLDRVRMQRMRARVFWIFVFCLALDPRQGVQTIHLPVVVLDAVSKPMFFTTIHADVLARFPCFVSERTF